MPEVTDKQKAWAKAYVGPAKFNATKAAEMSGFTPTQGPKMRSKGHVMAYVEELQREELNKQLVTQQRTLQEIIALAMSDISEIVQVTDEGGFKVNAFEDLPRHVTASIKKVKLRRQNKADGDFDELLELELHDKIKPLQMLGEWQGLFKGDGGDDKEDMPVFTGLEIIGPKEDTK